MILTVAIVIALILGFRHGYHRGLLRMLLSIVGYIVALMIARAATATIGATLANFFPILSDTGNTTQISDVNAFFYRGIAFMLVFGLVLGVCRWLIRRLNILTKVPIIHQANAMAGGMISLALVYLTIFIILVVLQVWPGTGWQTQLNQSVVAQWIIDKTPIISQQFMTWLTNR